MQPTTLTQPNSQRATSTVVRRRVEEATHPSWKNATTYLKSVVDKREKVRVTGWLTYDQEHHEQVGQTRRTLYEVHPIHSIQVWRGGQWVTL